MQVSKKKWGTLRELFCDNYGWWNFNIND
jgi:hypothetical protein